MRSTSLLSRGLLCSLSFFHHVKDIDAMEFLSDTSDIVAATQPLHREIELLKESLDILEGKHDTLEAASEQFRLKNKELKSKMEEERSKYDDLMVEKLGLEEKHNKETKALREKLRESEKAKKLLEVKLEKVQSDREKRTDEYVAELERAKLEAEKQSTAAKEAREKKEQMHELLGTYKQELSDIKTTYLQLRQELFAANQQLGELEQRAKLTPWSASLRRVQESQVFETGMDIFLDCWAWTRDTLAPRLYDIVVKAVSTIQEFLSLSKEEKYEHLSKAQALLLSSTKEILLLSMSLLKQAWEFSAPFLSMIIEGSPQKYVKFLLGLHRGATVCLELLLLAASSYYVTGLGGNYTDFAYSGMISMKERSSQVILLLEIIVGLLALDFAFTSMRSRVHKKRKQKWVQKRRNHQVSRALALKKVPHPTSLLRTAQPTLSRRPLDAGIPDYYQYHQQY